MELFLKLMVASRISMCSFNSYNLQKKKGIEDSDVLIQSVQAKENRLLGCVHNTDLKGSLSTNNLKI